MDSATKPMQNCGKSRDCVHRKNKASVHSRIVAKCQSNDGTSRFVTGCPVPIVSKREKACAFGRARFIRRNLAPGPSAGALVWQFQRAHCGMTRARRDQGVQAAPHLCWRIPRWRRRCGRSYYEWLLGRHGRSVRNHRQWVTTTATARTIFCGGIRARIPRCAPSVAGAAAARLNVPQFRIAVRHFGRATFPSASIRCRAPKAIQHHGMRCRKDY
jgi:hypothetical protein